MKLIRKRKFIATLESDDETFIVYIAGLISFDLSLKINSFYSFYYHFL